MNPLFLPLPARAAKKGKTMELPTSPEFRTVGLTSELRKCVAAGAGKADRL